MKREKNIEPQSRIIAKLIAEVVFLFLLTLSHNGVSQQNQSLNYGGLANIVVSGSGIGASVYPELFVSQKRHSVSFGINMQMRNCNFSGWRGGYQFLLTPNSEGIELFLFYQIGWHKNAILGKRSLEYESIISPGNANYFNTAKINTFESHWGFGINIATVNNWQIVGAIGIGFYKSIAIQHEEKYQYRQPSNNSMILSIGVKYTLQNVKKFILPKIKIKKPKIKPTNLIINEC